MPILPNNGDRDKFNVARFDVWISSNLDEYEKQVESVLQYVQMLKNEIKTLEEMQLNVEFNIETKRNEEENKK